MKFSENSNQAVDYLRLAVPKMVKHNIVPNPLNYTLWYSYFSQAFPELNQELDHIIERYQTCPPEMSESLFLQHIDEIDSLDKKSINDFQAALTNMVSHLSESLDQTAKDTHSYSSAIKSNINTLNQQQQDQENSVLFAELSANSEAICAANDNFQEQLNLAQEEINALRQELENTQREATTDQLTGLKNRRVLEGIYQQYTSEHSNEVMSVIMMDIDKFKIFNDTHGHLMGDQILKVVASLLKKECKAPITPVRFGGEEFALLCPAVDLEQAQSLAETIREKLANVPFTNKRTGKKITSITASFGVALKKSNELLNDFIERADKALYFAKSNGRNQVQVAKTS